MASSCEPRPPGLAVAARKSYHFRMTHAILGHTGFVGSNLARQLPGGELFNSQNIADIRGRKFDTVYCAAVRAEKWKANKEPDADRAGIAELLGHLDQLTCDRFVLISTVDVYANPVGVDEDTPIDPAAATAYGRHRYEFELEAAKRFDTTVIRLPGLFGDGIKKNVIFDLLTNNLVENIHPGGVYQYYNLDRIASDIALTLAAGLRVVNFGTEPVSTADVARVAFGRELPEKSTPAGRYDMRTKHAEIYGGHGGYLCDRERVLADLVAFVIRFPGRA